MMMIMMMMMMTSAHFQIQTLPLSKQPKLKLKFPSKLFLECYSIPCVNTLLSIYRVFSLVPPRKVLSTEKLFKARLGVSRTIYVSVDSPNLGFPYFNFLGGYQ